MNPQKKQWIDEVLGSADGLQRAEPGPFLFARIQHRLKDGSPAAYVPMRVVWLTVASFALLILLNWQAVIFLLKPESSTADELNTVITDLYLYPTTPQLYDAWSE